MHFPESLDRQAADEARRRGISKAALIRTAVEDALASQAQGSSPDPWEAMIGWLDDEPVEDIDEVIYGPTR